LIVKGKQLLIIHLKYLNDLEELTSQSHLLFKGFIEHVRFLTPFLAEALLIDGSLQLISYDFGQAFPQPSFLLAETIATLLAESKKDSASIFPPLPELNLPSIDIPKELLQQRFPNELTLAAVEQVVLQVHQWRVHLVAQALQLFNVLQHRLHLYQAACDYQQRSLARLVASMDRACSKSAIQQENLQSMTSRSDDTGNIDASLLDEISKRICRIGRRLSTLTIPRPHSEEDHLKEQLSLLSHIQESLQTLNI